MNRVLRVQYLLLPVNDLIWSFTFLVDHELLNRRHKCLIKLTSGCLHVRKRSILCLLTVEEAGRYRCQSNLLQLRVLSVYLLFVGKQGLARLDIVPRRGIQAFIECSRHDVIEFFRRHLVLQTPDVGEEVLFLEQQLLGLSAENFLTSCFSAL